MIWIDSRRFAAPAPTDPSFANVSLLLHGNGANGSSTIIDSSPSPKTVTAVGNAQISTAIADPFGNNTRGVLAFDGNSDRLDIPYSSNFQLLNTYTIEAWVYPLTVSAVFRPIFNIQAFSQSSFGGILLAVNGSSLVFEVKTLSGSGVGIFYEILGGSGTVAANAWQHVAVSISNNSARLFANGIQVGSTVSITDWGFAPVGVSVGANANGFNNTTQVFNGYIDELRITKGVARYTANFTPPTAPFPDA